MRSGVIHNLLTDLGTITVDTGTEDPGSFGYVGSNLSNIFDPGEVFRASPDTGTVVFTLVLDADTEIQGLALNEHNIPAGGHVQVEFFDDAGATSLVHDTGTVAVPTPTADPQNFPVVLDAVETVRAIRFTVTDLTDDFEIGSLPVGDWWEWPWITAGLEAGFDLGGSEQVLVGGGSYGPEGEDARTRTFEVSYMELATSSTTGLDFQAYQGLTRPFVYVEDYSDPTSFPRDVFLAVNDALQMISAALSDRDHVQFSLREVR